MSFFNKNKDYLNNKEILLEEILIIRLFYSFKYNKKNNNFKECNICFESFKDLDNFINIKCNHNFHSNCIINWFKKKFNCPCCRRNIRDDLIKEIQF